MRCATAVRDEALRVSVEGLIDEDTLCIHLQRRALDLMILPVRISPRGCPPRDCSRSMQRGLNRPAVGYGSMTDY